MKAKVKNTWDECKTKKEKDAFIKDLNRIEKTSKFISFDKLLKQLGIKEEDLKWKIKR